MTVIVMLNIVAFVSGRIQLKHKKYVIYTARPNGSPCRPLY